MTSIGDRSAPSIAVELVRAPRDRVSRRQTLALLDATRRLRRSVTPEDRRLAEAELYGLADRIEAQG